MSKITASKKTISSPTPSKDRIKINLDLTLEEAMILKIIVGATAGDSSNISGVIYQSLDNAGVKTDCGIQRRGKNVHLVPGAKPNTGLTKDNFSYAEPEAK